MNHENQIDGAAAAENQQILPDIFKLKIDHFEELFDWLSLDDMLKLAATCKRMQRIVGYCCRNMYSNFEVTCKDDGAYIELIKLDKMDGFTPFIELLRFAQVDTEKRWV